MLTAAVAASACTPLKILTRSYPEAFERDADLVDRVLRDFVTTVIPGAHAGAPGLVRAFRDPSYPFAPYAAFFAADLSRRTAARFGDGDFHKLTCAQRALVVGDGLAADATTRKVYGGAIYLAQISFYAGIYDDDRGCSLIDFPGRYRGDEVSYADAATFLPAALTCGGNFA